MDYKATLMVLVLVSSTLAGCTGDPDGGGNDEIDSDALQDLFDEHFEDFINNTTITVNNHYHNNTTVVNNDYNNTTINEGDESSTDNYNNQTDYSSSSSNYSFNGSGAGTGSIMQMFTVNWNPTDYADFYDYGNHTITLDGNLQQVNNDPSLLLKYVYNGYTVEFRNITCEEYLNFMYTNDNVWDDYLIDNYGYHDDVYSLAQAIAEDWDNLNDQQYNSSSGSYEYPLNDQCGFSTNSQENMIVLFEIHLTTGQAMDFLTTPWLYDIGLECDDGFHASLNGNYGNSSGGGGIGTFIGGQANCTVFGISYVYGSHTWIFVDNYDSGPNSSSGWWDSSNVPEWWPNSEWRFYRQNYSGGMHQMIGSPTPDQFAVYFTTYFVEVYDLDSE
jgi:hypothetical protein